MKDLTKQIIKLIFDLFIVGCCICRVSVNPSFLSYFLLVMWTLCSVVNGIGIGLSLSK